MPATKAIAKEMLPIVEEPTIQFIFEEAIASGIKAKCQIEDQFDANL